MSKRVIYDIVCLAVNINEEKGINMKINNIDVEKFLKDDNLVLNREKSLSLTGKKPSMQKRHVKNPKKVANAFMEIEESHNWSWYEEIKYRWKGCMEKPMTFYRGNEKSGYEVFEEADMLANSFLYHGIEKGDDIVLCMSNVPELLTVLLAASKCGAKVKLIGSGFDKEFIKETLSKSCKKIFIGTDDEYGKIEDVIRGAGFKRRVLVSLTDSLPKNNLDETYDPFEKYDKKVYEFKNKIGIYQSRDNKIERFVDFKRYAKGLFASFPNVRIDDEFTATYTSGSTKIGWPKTILHTNRHYTTIGRFHDPDLSRMPAMRNMRGLAYIPTHSNTNIASGISDTLCQMCTVAFEPIYNSNFFAYSLEINKPGFVPATRSFWLKALQDFRNNEDLMGKDLSYLVNAVAVGEDITHNEVHFIDKGFRELKAGSAVLPKPLSPITVSVGGGCCELGGLFFTLFKSGREKLSLRKSSREDFGLTPFQLADVAVLREDGTECDYEEYGNLVANSSLTMKEYENNEEATKAFYTEDNYNRTWGNANVWSYIGKNGNVVMKGRRDSKTQLSNGKEIPNFLIADPILKDEKNVLSCEVVTVKDKNDNDVAVAHIKLQPDAKKTENEVLVDAELRCQKMFSEELYNRVVYHFLSDNEEYELTKSGKRSLPALEACGLNDCVKPVFYRSYCNSSGAVVKYNLVSAEKYVDAYLPKAQTIDKPVVKAKV